MTFAKSTSATTAPTEILSRLFTESELQRDWFADSFLAQISLAEISQITQGIISSVGAYQSIEDVPNGFVLTFDRGTVPAHLALNSQGQITGLLFETPQLAGLSLDDVLSELSSLPGEVHVLATRNGGEVSAINADNALAVGSTFKLLILQALQTQIAQGAHQWDEVVTIKEEWKSLPSGFLQTWPEGSALTLESLATLMISQSDNTATDHLLHIVGRDTLEGLSPRNRPFLTTREAFVLKDPANRSILRRWRSREEKRSLISALAALPLPAVSIFNEGPQAIDIEWFFTARELCNAMDAVADLPLMSVNPGLVDPDQWDSVAFKGGSEPGVENFTTRLVDDQGALCVTATWNNPAGIDELKFSTLYRSLIESVRNQMS
ncbi:MAG: serine hydrolase [Cyanobacteria bacterium J06643_4]